MRSLADAQDRSAEAAPNGFKGNAPGESPEPFLFLGFERSLAWGSGQGLFHGVPLKKQPNFDSVYAKLPLRSSPITCRDFPESALTL